MSAKLPFLLRHRWILLAFGGAITAFNLCWFLINPFSILRLFNVFGFFGGSCAAWYYAHKKPFGWLYFGLGTRVDISHSSQIKDMNSEQVDAAVTEWLRDAGITKLYQKTDAYTYFFLRRKDAVQFKLTWA